VPEVENDFNEWYNIDHLPQLAAVPGVHGARRYRKLSGNGTQYLALYEFDNAQVRSTAAWAQAANTEWTKKIRPHLKPLANIGQRIL
jgi:antibiotic biosynthesis monooxygenase (ABM) superfamily enzyme